MIIKRILRTCIFPAKKKKEKKKKHPVDISLLERSFIKNTQDNLLLLVWFVCLKDLVNRSATTLHTKLNPLEFERISHACTLSTAEIETGQEMRWDLLRSPRQNPWKWLNNKNIIITSFVVHDSCILPVFCLSCTLLIYLLMHST